MTDENTQTSETQIDVEKLKADYEAKIAELTNASVGKDKKVNDLVRQVNLLTKEKETKELAGKTAEEQLSEYQKKIKSYEQKEAFRQSFKDAGLNPDEFQEIINEPDYKTQASKFAELLKTKTSESVNSALEQFKKENLGKIPNEAKPPATTEIETKVDLAFKKGLGL